MDSGPLHSHTGPYRIDSLVITDYGYFCPLSWLANDFFDFHDSFVDFGDFKFKQPLHEQRVSTTDYDLWITCSVSPHFLDHGSNHVAFSIPVSVNLFVTGKNQLRFVVNHEDFSPADLINFSNDDFTYIIRVPFVHVFLLNITDSLAECLSGSHHCTPAKIFEIDFLGNLVSDFDIFVDKDGFGQSDLCNRIFDIPLRNNFADM